MSCEDVPEILGEVETETLPAVQHLPAIGVPGDLTTLKWSEPLIVDSKGSVVPSCLALDSDRIVANWVRWDDPKPRYMTVVQLSRRKAGPLVPTGFNDKDHPWIQERRLAPLGPSQCVVADRAGSDRVVGRVANVADLTVSLSDPTELGSPCGRESDLYRLDNGLYVVSGRGLCGHTDRPSLAVFRANSDGVVAVESRGEVNQTNPAMSFLVSRSENRVGLAHAGGLDVYGIGSDGAVSGISHVAVPGMSREDWYRGLGVDLGGGRVAQLYVNTDDPTVLVVDLCQSGPTMIVGRFHHPKPTEHARRACCTGGYLIIPGEKVLDVFDTRSKSPSSWQHVTRYDLPDLRSCGFPCVVGQQLVLLYYSTSLKLTLRIGKN